MTSDTGAKPPLHRRFSERVAKEHISNRYAEFGRRIPSQITKLQQDSEFRSLCAEYYKKGYKDWLIISAVFNCMLNWKLNRSEVDLRNPQSRRKMQELAESMSDTVYPPWRFDREQMDRAIVVFNGTVLSTYGFELRRADFNPDAVERFLRERMRHFEIDLPHKPLFGDPPGDWPRT